MAVEQARGCGHRKVGGLYLVCDAPGAPCCKIPFELHVCPTCNQGIKQSRGWQWIDPRPWSKGPCTTPQAVWRKSARCPLADPDKLGDKVGLIWIGAEYYATPADFMAEAHKMGISRRIKAVPRGFKLGEHWVFLAHPRLRSVTVSYEATPMHTALEWIAGVFQVIRPTRIEKIITDVQANDREEFKKLIDAGITPVIVPADDPDHAARGSKAMEAELI
jgi:hypothetical protein